MTVTKKMEEYTLSKSIITDGEPVRSVACITSASASTDNIISSGLFLMSGTEGGIISSTDLTSFDSNVLLESTKHGHHITALIGIPMGTVTSESESESESGSDDSYVGGYVS